MRTEIVYDPFLNKNNKYEINKITINIYDGGEFYAIKNREKCKK